MLFGCGAKGNRNDAHRHTGQQIPLEKIVQPLHCTAASARNVGCGVAIYAKRTPVLVSVAHGKLSGRQTLLTLGMQLWIRPHPFSNGSKPSCPRS
ncbi:Hypothetical protein HDN1F_12340 [gamma proteobacterium HdN1]|nr:Hypothetical protein HDN1F_12340 [gamma proteobacterium HdN1]